MVTKAITDSGSVGRCTAWGTPSSRTSSLTGRHSSPSSSPATSGVSLLNTTTRPDVRTRAAVRVEHARCDRLTVPVHVDVKNAGDRDGAHTVLVYHAAPASAAGEGAPVRQLVAFEKVHVPAGGVARVEMGVDFCDGLSVAGKDGVRRIHIGEHSLMIGEVTHSITIGVEQLGV